MYTSLGITIHTRRVPEKQWYQYALVGSETIYYIDYDKTPSGPIDLHRNQNADYNYIRHIFSPTTLTKLELIIMQAFPIDNLPGLK